MEKLAIGSSRYTSVFAVGNSGNGNAFHDYRVDASEGAATQDVGSVGSFAEVHFQNGPILDVGGVNGCFNEDLIVIVIHRLQCFQSSAYACRENALALTKLEEALHWLNHRTGERTKRGVEGTHAI